MKDTVLHLLSAIGSGIAAEVLGNYSILAALPLLGLGIYKQNSHLMIAGCTMMAIGATAAIKKTGVFTKFIDKFSFKKKEEKTDTLLGNVPKSSATESAKSGQPIPEPEQLKEVVETIQGLTLQENLAKRPEPVNANQRPTLSEWEVPEMYNRPLYKEEPVFFYNDELEGIGLII